MKKSIAVLVVLLIAAASVFAGGAKEDVKSEGVMTYAEFEAAPLNSEVVVETYIQAKQAYAAAYGNTSLYTMDKEGGYFIYRVACTQEEYDKLAVGTKIKVTGYKSEWSGEVEITDAKIEVIQGSYKAAAKDVTAFFGTEELLKNQNQLVAIKGAKVTKAALYNWDGSGQAGSNNDLYFDVKINDLDYTFTVESDLCAEGTDVYNKVLTLKAGDTIDLEGFLYWYNGAQPHVTKVTVK